MTELNLIDSLLTALTGHGPVTVGLVALLGSLGVPVIPAPFLVLAAGALARQGLIDLSTVLFLGLLGALLGDSTGYALGRVARRWVQRRWGGSSTWARATDRFNQSGAHAIYITRVLLTPLAVPTNLIAGGSGYPLRRFLAYDLAGSLSWLLGYAGLGYAFGVQWPVISQAVANYSGWILGAVALGIGVYLLLRRLRQNRQVPTASRPVP
jgi:membrane-associated protein